MVDVAMSTVLAVTVVLLAAWGMIVVLGRGGARAAIAGAIINVAIIALTSVVGIVLVTSAKSHGHGAAEPLLMRSLFVLCFVATAIVSFSRDRLSGAVLMRIAGALLKAVTVTLVSILGFVVLYTVMVGS